MLYCLVSVFCRDTEAHYGLCVQLPKQTCIEISIPGKSDKKYNIKTVLSVFSLFSKYIIILNHKSFLQYLS